MFDLVSGSLNAIRKSFLGKPAPAPEFAPTVQPDPNFPATVFVSGRAVRLVAAAHTSVLARSKFDLPESPLDNVAADPLASTWLMDLPER